jgi:hypothetical protein
VVHPSLTTMVLKLRSADGFLLVLNHLAC